MKVTPWCLAALAPIAVAGCSGAFLGHFAVLALTLGIFFGTLSLGRHSTALNAAPQASGSPASPSVATSGDAPNV
ncbi:hypothetical protein LZC95_20500 [Pendulispora brunnea]|uniref:Uncharacterized protein n=1 Tax=Pendulispora brunnea TaxID=2905690 RepID=A0ABZ2KNM8_9BACT